MWALLRQIWQKRQLADYYLADPEIYKKTVEALPSEKRLDSDGNRLSESELYNNAVDSVQTSQLNYTEDEKKENLSFLVSLNVCWKLCDRKHCDGFFDRYPDCSDCLRFQEITWYQYFYFLGKEKF